MLGKFCWSLCAIVRGGAGIVLIPALLAVAGIALAEEKEPVAVLELGAAGSWDVHGGTSFGPSSAVEFAPIKNYLVMEAGLTPFFDNLVATLIGTLTCYSDARSICRRKWGVEAGHWANVEQLGTVRCASVL